MIKKTIFCLILTAMALAISSCAQPQQTGQKETTFRKKSSEPGRSPTPEMIFFEDAENRKADDEVIVIPPDEVKKNKEKTEN